ncbi:4485_t:CDS:2 [Scutellospora calospora]|uniref:4485_t:CDS:1 n=1 Tax=Scutellospora calospora TaxID=85575 RepID=A0ACA9K566_9GLOM|nr:4485_t:CDS:2 [Scutellospora calospora]
MVDISYLRYSEIEGIISAWLLAIAIALTLDSFIRALLNRKIPTIQLSNIVNIDWLSNNGYWLLKPVNLATLISEIIMPLMLITSSYCSNIATNEVDNSNCYYATKRTTVSSLLRTKLES